MFHEDLVARIPLYPPPLILHLLSPYVHCGQEIFLPATGGYDTSPSLRQLLKSDVHGLYHALKVRGVLGMIEEPLDDHAVAKNYVAAFQKLQPLMEGHYA